MWVGDEEYRAETVIVATGASARQLGLESEQRLQGRGVSYCATCDAAFFRDKVVTSSAAATRPWKRRSSSPASRARSYLVHRREEFRASPIMVDRARTNEKIELVLNKVVEEVLGEDKVTAVRLRDTVTGEVSEIATDGFFVAIGHDPTTGALPRRARSRPGHRATSSRSARSTATNLPGVFAAGDVQDHVYRQAVTAAGSGCMAALDAERFLSEQRHAALSAAAS